MLRSRRRQLATYEDLLALPECGACAGHAASVQTDVAERQRVEAGIAARRFVVPRPLADSTANKPAPACGDQLELLGDTYAAPATRKRSVDAGVSARARACSRPTFRPRGSIS